LKQLQVRGVVVVAAAAVFSPCTPQQFTASCCHIKVATIVATMAVAAVIVLLWQ